MSTTWWYPEVDPPRVEAVGGGGAPASLSFLGTRIDRVDPAALAARLDDFAASPRFHRVVTVNVDFVHLARVDPRFRAAINSAELAVPDGMPLVWLSRLAPYPLPSRITGTQVLETACALAARDGRSVFVLGGLPGVADAAASVLSRRFPGLRVAGTYCPPFGEWSPGDGERTLAEVNRARPDFLFVGLGAVKQELWLHQHRHQLETRVAVGVGAVLDFVTGRVPRAPEWLQRLSLEWLHRVYREPRRLWRRYFLQDLPTVMRIAWSRPWELAREGR